MAQACTQTLFMERGASAICAHACMRIAAARHWRNRPACILGAQVHNRAFSTYAYLNKRTNAYKCIHAQVHKTCVHASTPARPGACTAHVLSLPSRSSRPSLSSATASLCPRPLGWFQGAGYGGTPAPPQSLLLVCHPRPGLQANTHTFSSSPATAARQQSNSRVPVTVNTSPATVASNSRNGGVD